VKFITGPMPKRVFKGIFEIIGYVRELLGEDDLSRIPERIDLKAVTVESKRFGYYFTAYTGQSDPSAIHLQIPVRNNNIVEAVLHCGNEDVNGSYSFDANINLFYDVRRVEEFVDIVSDGDGNDVEQVVAVAYLENRGLRISVLVR